MSIPKFPELEEQILKDWKEKDIFKKTLAKPSPKGNFVFFDGPPTANGIPHIGHVETRAFKDIIPRFKTMQGYHVERKAGWDTQGLPVELEVETDLGITGKKDIEKFGIAEFNAKAKESVWKYKDLWEKMTNRVGFWLDTENPYITYQPEYIESLWWIFKQIWDQKLLIQDYKVVPYCPRCGTALSSHEVAQGYQKVKDRSVYVKFKLKSKQKVLDFVTDDNTYIIAWTTTPWTLPGNVALAVSIADEYVLVSDFDEKEKVIFSKRYFDSLPINPTQIIAGENPHPKLLKEFHGGDIVTLAYEPLFDFLDLRTVKTTNPRHSERREESPDSSSLSVKEIPRATRNDGGAGNENAYTIVSADFVTTTDGTGVVHTAVMYGEDDFQLGQKLDLPKIHTVDLQGKFNELVKPWVGKEVKDEKGETQHEVIKYLKEHNGFYKEEKYEHDYPFCWRCKHPLLYYAKTSWFIQMSKLRNELIANNEKITWYPNHIKEGRFGEWLREVKDWAISRERYWGTPIPIWVCDNPDCKHQECLGSYQELLDRVPARNRYIFVRHGESKNNAEKTINTMRDRMDISPLTERGKIEAAKLVEKLAEIKLDGIYSSQFLRAKQTAEYVARAKDLDISEDARLNEFLIGQAFEGKSYDEYHAAYPVTNRKLRFKQASADGETWLDVRTRMIAFLRELDQKFEGKTFLIVSHADPIMVAQWAISMQPETQLPEEYPANATPIEVKFGAALLQPDGSFDPHRPFVDGITYPCVACQTGTMQRILEVADAWFDSGAMPFAQHHYPFENVEKIDQGQNYPAEYISEAIDQTRGWFYTLLAISTLLQKSQAIKQSSYTNVIVLGHLNDATGRKLSKSLKNYSSLDELFAAHGADALRWFMYTTNQPWDSKNFDPKIVDEGVKKTFLILMNVVSFYKLAPTPASTQAGTASAHPLDCWVVSLLDAVTLDVTQRLESYDVTGAARAIAAFVTELSTWYVRRSRDRFKNEHGPTVTAMLQHCLLTVSKLLAPFTPFLAEYMYHQVGGTEESVHLENWPTAGKVDQKLLTDMEIARKVVEQGHALRAKSGLKVRQPLQQVVTTQQLRPDLDEIVRDELNVKELHQADKLPNGNEWAVGENVALDITVTDELKEEGLFRDLIREFNALRKIAKLQPADTIVAHVQAHTVAAKIVERFAQEFLQQVRASAVTPSVDEASEKVVVTFDGEEVTIGLTR